MDTVSGVLDVNSKESGFIHIWLKEKNMLGVRSIPSSTDILLDFVVLLPIFPIPLKFEKVLLNIYRNYDGLSHTVSFIRYELLSIFQDTSAFLQI